MDQTTTAEQPRTAERDRADAPPPRRRLADLARRPVGVAVAGVVLAAATFTGGLVVGRATAADPGTAGGSGPGQGQGPGGQGGFGQGGPGQQGQGQQGQQQAPNQLPGQVPALPSQPQDDDPSDGSSSTTTDPVATGT